MRTEHVLCLGRHGFHRVNYYDWGDRTNPHVVICVHGLTRNARDFDFLAQVLASDCRVVCPDVVGRGKSDWLKHARDYEYPLYIADMTTLIARVTGVRKSLKRWLARIFGRQTKPVIDWVGTSMGGLIGMMLAAQANSPIRRLVVNDVGPLVPAASLRRIGQYVGKDPRFASLEEVESYIRKYSAPFGPLTDSQWRHLALHSAKQYADGTWGFVYDPAIGEPFRSGLISDVSLWEVYDKVSCPTLVLRGADSDLLLAQTGQEMTVRGPRAKFVEFLGVGHAPMLMAEDQIKTVKDFLMARE
ncbi:MAG: alpha/beta fold hydrolase [Burkholderiales bacterium]